MCERRGYTCRCGGGVVGQVCLMVEACRGSVERGGGCKCCLVLTCRMGSGGDGGGVCVQLLAPAKLQKALQARRWPAEGGLA